LRTRRRRRRRKRRRIDERWQGHEEGTGEQITSTR
jgi:hypothetical protein